MNVGATIRLQVPGVLPTLPAGWLYAVAAVNQQLGLSRELLSRELVSLFMLNPVHQVLLLQYSVQSSSTASMLVPPEHLKICKSLSPASPLPVRVHAMTSSGAASNVPAHPST